jgi:uncharacterized membrane protein
MKHIRRIVLLLLTFCLVAGISELYGHGKEHHVRTDSLDSKTEDSADVKGPMTVKHDEPQEPYQLAYKEALTEHLHNRVIHLPIGFALAAFLLSVLAFRWQELQPAVRWLVFVAALTSILAYITGTSQAQFFEISGKKWVVELHQRLGIITATGLFVWTLFLFIQPMKRFAFFIGVLVVLLILITGFYGGILAHE